MLMALCAAGYLAGSINLSIILLKKFGNYDHRREFYTDLDIYSIYKSIGVFQSAVAILFDIIKAAGFAILSLNLIEINLLPWVCLSIVAGNVFPCFHGFKGEKGVLYIFAFSAIIIPVWTIFSIFVLIITYIIFRIPYVAGLFMVTILSIGTLFKSGFTITSILGISITLIIILFSHRKDYKKRIS